MRVEPILGDVNANENSIQSKARRSRYKGWGGGAAA
jgi:hypothetical protein